MSYAYKITSQFAILEFLNDTSTDTTYKQAIDNLAATVERQICDFLNYDYGFFGARIFKGNEYFEFVGNGQALAPKFKYPADSGNISISETDLLTGILTGPTAFPTGKYLGWKLIGYEARQLLADSYLSAQTLYTINYRVPSAPDDKYKLGWPAAVKQVATEMTARLVLNSHWGNGRFGRKNDVNPMNEKSPLLYDDLWPEWKRNLHPYKYIET